MTITNMKVLLLGKLHREGCFDMISKNNKENDNDK